jgi:ATP-binding cassette subfamily B protein
MTYASAGPARLWRLLWGQLSRGDRIRLLTAAAAMLAASAMAALLPLLVGLLIDHILRAKNVQLSDASGRLGEIAVLAVVTQLLQVVRRQLVESVATSFERDSRQRAYEHLMRLDLDRLRHGQLGGIYGRADRSIEGAVRLIKLGAMDLLPAVTLAISAIVVAVTRAPVVALAMSMVIPTSFVLVRWQVTNQAGVRLRIRDHKEAIDSMVVELLPALEVVRVAGADTHFMLRIREATGRLRDTELRHHIAMSLFDAGKAINETLWLLVTLGVSVQLSSGGHTSAGQLTSYFLLYLGVTAPIRDLHRIIDEGAESAQQTADLLDLLGEEEDESYHPSNRPRLAVMDERRQPALAMRSVRFTHAGETDPVLHDVTLEIWPGERVGIVGRSGCGKSTLLKLVARLHHGAEGAIRLGGRNVRDIQRGELVDMVGFVGQEAKLFRGSVLENITLGRPAATLQDAIRAAKRANVHHEIVAMSGGYDAIIGERGETLSGGQRQRLCLARALLKAPPVLLLDEPTSALDGPSQAAVQSAIDTLENVTLVVVAHRLSTLRTMDRIVVLDGGTIVEEGSFTRLAVAGGLFTEMLASQGEDPAPGTTVQPARTAVSAMTGVLGAAS